MEKILENHMNVQIFIIRRYCVNQCKKKLCVSVITYALLQNMVYDYGNYTSIGKGNISLFIIIFSLH